MASPASGEFALSMGAVAKLKYSARQDRDEGIRQSAKQFEALFLQQMLKQMRAGLPESNLLHSQQSDMYQSLMDQQWAQTLSERGIGLADMLTAQLQGKPKGNASGSEAADPLAAIATAAPQPLHASDAIAPSRQSTTSTDSADSLERTHFARPPLKAAVHNAVVPDMTVAPSEAAQATAPVRRALLPDHVNDFLDRMDGAAAVASRDSGVPKRLILAQAALETGWGRHEIARADGRPSYNVFNIKATGWDGDAAAVTTTEFKRGQSYQTRAAFRAYDSYEHAFGDYARLLSESPRYAPVINASTAEGAARALQNCGYATDPAYADKLVSIMRRLPADVSAPQGTQPAAAAQALKVAQAESAGLTHLF